MADNIYSKLKKGKTKKAEEELVDDSLVEEAFAEAGEVNVVRTVGAEREAVDLYYDKTLRKYVKVTIKYNDVTNEVLSVDSKVTSANMAIELSAINTHFVNKIMKKR